MIPEDAIASEGAPGPNTDATNQKDQKSGESD
jgi:hypothetical protein